MFPQQNRKRKGFSGIRKIKLYLFLYVYIVCVDIDLDKLHL